MNKTKIEWTDYTWNPVTGCHNDCSYCYARKIGLRFQGHFNPTFHPDRLKQPYKAKPSKIFVCSMSDLFAPWIPVGWINQIIKVAKENPQHTFQFLTKYPSGYRRIRKYPKNCWLGATITNDEDSHRLSSLYMLKNKTFVSYEPLLSAIPHYSLTHLSWVIVGALTGWVRSKKQTKREWVEGVLKQVDKYEKPVFMKNNLKPIWKGKLRQEFPSNQG